MPHDQNKVDEFFDDELALSYLLKEGVLFANSRQYVCLDGKIKEATIVLFVLLNDVFVPAADAESIKLSELLDFYILWKDYDYLGVVFWAMGKRKAQPRKSLVEEIKKKNLWVKEFDGYKKSVF